MLTLKLATRLARPVAPAALRSRSFTSTSALLSKTGHKPPFSIPPQARQRIFPETIREYERLLAEDPAKAEEVCDLIILYCVPGSDADGADHEAQEQLRASSEEKKSDSGKDE